MTAAADGKDLWVVGGGDLVGQFADAGLLDEVIVYIAPVTLGGGAPLLPRKLDLRLEELAQNRAFACARYSVVGPADRTGSGDHATGPLVLDPPGDLQTAWRCPPGGRPLASWSVASHRRSACRRCKPIPARRAGPPVMLAGRLDETEADP